MSECIEWTGYRNKDGYGRVMFDGKVRQAHRVAYCKHKNISLDEIAGLVIRHTCDNPPCINPLHLEAGTHRDNMQDMITRGRDRKRPLLGQEHHKAKLTDEQISAIRKHISDGRKQREIALEFGVTQAEVSHINTGKRWKHL